MTDHTDLCKRLRTEYHHHPDLFGDAADAIEALQADVEALLKIIAAIKRDPGGCPFCDSGKLRRSGVPDKDHNDDCAWKLMRDFDAALAAARD